MTEIILFILGVLGGSIIGICLARLLIWLMERRRRTELDREVERQRGLRQLQLEYAGKVDPSLIETVAHSPHSVEEVRRILDQSIEMQRELEELFGPGGTIQENVRRKWEGIL